MVARTSFSSRKRTSTKIWQACLIGLFWCSFLFTIVIPPAVGANRIAFSSGIFGEFYVSVADLEVFAKSGTITPSFAYYADRVSSKNLSKLRDLLNQSFDVDRVTASIFLDLAIGRQLTKEISLIIDSPTKVSVPALKAAVILAAAKPEGLTILNVLRLYSTKTLKLNTKQIIKAVDEATKILADTERVFTTLAAEGKVEDSNNNSFDINTFKNLANSDSYKWRRESLAIESSNSRQTEGIVYLPLNQNQPAPLIIIAPGLNTDWRNFAYLAEHLASYGFGVAALNFPGTDAQRVSAVLSGLDTPPANNQWVEQPIIITHLLDKIKQKSQEDLTWQGKLDLQRVGIIGQSLGGYTAMAIAGAKVDWHHLKTECRKLENPDRINFNPALYWQCQGVKDSPPNTNLQDKRIVAAIAINPVTNPVFSQKSLNAFKSPLMMIAGDRDYFAPAISEQLKPFTWLPENDKYLVLVKNSTHFSFINERENNEIEPSSATVGSDSTVARSYIKSLSVAFCQTYLARKEFKSYLTETYFQSISKQQLPLNSLRSLNSDRLKELINEQT